MFFSDRNTWKRICPAPEVPDFRTLKFLKLSNLSNPEKIGTSLRSAIKHIKFPHSTFP